MPSPESGTEVGLETCVSLGTISAEDITYLRSRGLRSVHHNLQTSRTLFPSICTRHDYEKDVQAVADAKTAGRGSAAGIFGTGETLAGRVELPMTLRELDVDSIPLNLLNPIEGTPLERKSDLISFSCIKNHCHVTILPPTKEIIVCGGREVHWRDLQGLMFAAGATESMIGNYLTPSGRPMEDDPADD